MIKQMSSSWFASLLLAAVPASAQQAGGPFDAATVVLPRWEAPFRLLLDAEGDGDVDAITAQLGAPHTYFRYAVYLNDGSGKFSRVQFGYDGLDTRVDELQLAVGRLNGDDQPDFTIVGGKTRHDYLSIGMPYVNYQQRGPIMLPSAAKRFALAQLDGDGISDFAWLDDTQLHVSMSNGTTAEIATSSVGEELGLRVLPKNGPGACDVFLTLIGEQIHVFFGSPSGLVAGPVFDTGIDHGKLEAGDLDGDADQDAIVFGSGSPAHERVLRRDSPSAWTLLPSGTGGPAECLADVDGDGDLDGVGCNGGATTGGDEWDPWPDNVHPSGFEVSLNDGNGGFAPAFEIPGVGSPEFAGAADVDGDGDIDLVAGRCIDFADGAIRALRAVGAAPAFRGPRDLSDPDGDGDPDVGFSLDSVERNDGSGRFTAETPLVLPPPAGARYAGPGFPGDFDGDGDVDLLVELRTDSRVQASSRRRHERSATCMGLLGNDGAGNLATLGLASDFGVSFALDSLEAEASLPCDVDRDGDLDLVTRNLGARTASRMWINRGAGFFDPGPCFAEARVQWAGDYDLDGDTDLVTSRPSGAGRSAIGLYRGTPRPGGVPRFEADASIDSLSWMDFDPFAGGLAVGDCVRDGYPDFVVTSGLYNDALMLMNTTGTGGTMVANVSMQSEFITGSFIDVLPMRPDSRASLGDLNGDGLEDSLVGIQASEEVEISNAVLKIPLGPAYGPGSFRFVQQLVPPGLLVDLDTDGDLDVLGSRIVFNRTNP